MKFHHLLTMLEVNRDQYTAFGEIREKSGVTETKYRYTGQLAQDVLGLDYYVARWYDPYLNRWIQPDSIIPDSNDPHSWDRYSYVRNNPIKFTDPSGHDKDCGLDEAGCKERVRTEKRIQYFEGEKQRCAKDPGGENCPDYGGLALFTITVMALPGPDEIGIFLDSAAGGLKAAYDFVLSKGAKCTSDPTCLYILNYLSGNAEMNESNYSNSNLGITSGGNAPPNTPTVYRGGSDLTPRIEDVKINPNTGLVKPGHGISLNTDPSKVLKFGEPNEVISVPEGLQILQRGANLGHYEITPSMEMTFEEFGRLLQMVITIPLINK
jgi:RHS repeat-associated protein